MAKTTSEKLMNLEEQIRQLENEHKQLLQKKKEEERKARTKRLIERGSIVESLIDGCADMTNEQIKEYVSAVISEYKPSFTSKPTPVIDKPKFAEAEQVGGSVTPLA
jgi:polyhydroxyalkanoate synthesis regulator phasin